jgi:hypothetical protein
MQYSNEIFKYYFEGSHEDWLAWIQTKPPFEQVDILNELREILIEFANELNIDGLRESIKIIEEKTSHYQETILDEQLALLKYEMAIDDYIRFLKENSGFSHQIRSYVLERIAANHPDAESLKLFARHIMRNEKETGIYDPLNWVLFDPEG